MLQGTSTWRDQETHPLIAGTENTIARWRNFMATLPELAAALADLRAHADELDKLDDELTAMIPDVEDALRGLRLGVRITVQMESGDRWEKVLAFDRYGKDWRLLIEEGPDTGDPEDWQVTALASAPRDDRASVFEWHLDSLLMSASKQIKEKVAARRKTLEETKSIVETVKNAAKPRRAKS